MIYPLKFIQKDICKDGSGHLFTYIYKFYCLESKLHYIIRAEYHSEDVFAVKFYCKKDRKSDYKYNKILNKHSYSVVIRIFKTCLSIVPKLLQEYPNCSFAIVSSPTIDISTSKKLTENIIKNQRFRVYSRFLQERVGSKTFTHFMYENVSSYLLINNNNQDICFKELSIKKMFENTYNFLPTT